MNYLLPTTIIYPNAKGQITLPKKLRDQLDIQPTTPLAPLLSGNQIILTPIASLQAKPAPPKAQSTQLYSKWKQLQGTWADSPKLSLEILNETAGAWAGDDWPQTEAKRRKIELKVARSRKKAW